MKKLVVALLTLLIGITDCFGQTTVNFTVEELPQITNQKVGIRGNLPPLDWSKSIELIKGEDAYAIDLSFPEDGTELEFKFVLFSNDEKPVWEGIDNRTLKLLGNGAHQTSNNLWNREQVIDISVLGKIDVPGLQEDYKLIETMVLKVHPGTYRYNSKDQILGALEELKTKFSSPLTHQEAYLAISKMTAQLKCDHTKAGFNNQGKVINSIIHYQSDKLPFTFRWLGDEMVILQNASEVEKLQRGARVVSLNKVPVQEIRDEIVTYIGADGATDNNRMYKSQVNAYDFRYNAFDIFYPLIYPLNNNTLQLEFKAPNQEVILTTEVSTMTREERFGILTERYKTFPKSRDDMWGFELLSDDIALVTLNSFGLMGWKAMTIDYKAFLEKVFKELDKLEVAHLIIDIRENNGGNDEMAEELFTYLSAYNYNFDREGRTRYLDFPDSLKPYIKSWGENPWYYHLKPENKNPVDGYYIFKENFSQKAKKSNKKIFKGKSYLLTSAANTSLAFYTAYRFKYQKIGTTVGQETGGNLNDINGGQILFLTLPNSGIEIDFPVMGGFSGKRQPNTGVMPDIEVQYEIQDIIKQSDLEVEAVRNLINDQ